MSKRTRTESETASLFDTYESSIKTLTKQQHLSLIKGLCDLMDDKNKVAAENLLQSFANQKDNFVGNWKIDNLQGCDDFEGTGRMNIKLTDDGFYTGKVYLYGHRETSEYKLQRAKLNKDGELEIDGEEVNYGSTDNYFKFKRVDDDKLAGEVQMDMLITFDCLRAKEGKEQEEDEEEEGFSEDEEDDE